MGGNFKLNKKLLTFMAACLMATGIGALVTNNTHVEVTTFINEEGYSVYDEKTAYNELRRASLITPRLNYTGKNQLKFIGIKKLIYEMAGTILTFLLAGMFLEEIEEIVILV